METKREGSFGRVLLQIALGLFFIVGGIWTIMGDPGDEAAFAVQSIFNGNIVQYVCIAYGVIEIIAGVFLLLKLFVSPFEPLNNILMVVIMIAWIVAIVMIDFVGSRGQFDSFSKFLSWCRTFASHCLVLGSIFIVKD